LTHGIFTGGDFIYALDLATPYMVRMLFSVHFISPTCGMMDIFGISISPHALSRAVAILKAFFLPLILQCGL
jgi:hypothetical protein